jgi:glycosyltransferase involved in cell wall biosynthesis
VFAVNELMADRLLALGVPAAKLSVVPNSPDLGLFDPTRWPHRRFREDGSLRLVYTGALTPTYELDVALDACARLVDSRPDLDVRLELYGRGDSEAQLRGQAAALGIADRVTFHGRVPLEEVPPAVAAADVGIAPTRLDEFTRVSLSTKVFEYGAMGKPVVASRLPLVERTFPADTVLTYPSGGAPDLAASIARLADDPLEREARVARTASRVRELGWATEADRYADLIDRLDRRAPVETS